MITVKNQHYCEIEPLDIKIDRSTFIGNPWTHLKGDTKADKQVATRDIAVAHYRKWFKIQTLDYDPRFWNIINKIIIQKLKGLDFGLLCWCSPSNCHGNTIKQYVESQKYCRNWFTNMSKMDEPLIYQNISYYTVENFYQAMKTNKSDTKERQKISEMSPFDCKKYSKKIKKRESFESQKIDIMRIGLQHKFKQPKWKKYLEQNDQPIIEYNNWNDKFWGVSIFDDQGENHLGKLLEEIKEKV